MKISIHHRSLTRRTTRRLSRYCTRMLNGARRPDLLALYCRIIARIIKIDESLRPFMKEQTRLYEEHLRHQEVEAALRRVYGTDFTKPTDTNPVKDR